MSTRPTAALLLTVALLGNGPPVVPVTRAHEACHPPTTSEEAQADQSDFVFLDRIAMLKNTFAANEVAAAETLRALWGFQAQLQAAAAIDADGDGQGEHAYFGELAGTAPCRSAPGEAREILQPALTSAALGRVTATGNVVRDGYVFRMYLPGKPVGDKVPGLAEAPGGGSAGSGPIPEPDACELLWACYAWPLEAGKTGRRVFFANQEGSVLVTANVDRAYSGETKAPAFDAAYNAPVAGSMIAPSRCDAKGNDGHVWFRLYSEIVPVDPLVELGPASRADLEPGAAIDANKVILSRKDALRLRMSANQAAAITVVHCISSSEAVAQSVALIDMDRDGSGEYAYLAELAGTVPIRAVNLRERVRLPEPLLSKWLGQISSAGDATKYGYLYRLYLPGRTVGNKTPGIPESAGGGAAASGPQPDAENSEVLWCMYAWPVEAGTTGTTAYFLNQEGDLLETANLDHAYSGESKAPAFDAAFCAHGPGDMAHRVPLMGAKSNDGHVWTLVGM